MGVKVGQIKMLGYCFILLCTGTINISPVAVAVGLNYSRLTTENTLNLAEGSAYSMLGLRKLRHRYLYCSL